MTADTREQFTKRQRAALREGIATQAVRHGLIINEGQLATDGEGHVYIVVRTCARCGGHHQHDVDGGTAAAFGHRVPLCRVESDLPEYVVLPAKELWLTDVESEVTFAMGGQSE